MEERELRITYGMCFKLAGDIVGRLLEADSDHEIKDIVGDVEQLASELADAAMEGQEAFVSDNQHRVTVTRSSSKPGRSSGGSGSYPRKSGGTRPKNPTAPASEKQVALATRLYWEKEHDVNVDPSSFEAMTMGEIGPIIEQLLNA